jgi:hypothetical protein
MGMGMERPRSSAAMVRMEAEEPLSTVVAPELGMDIAAAAEPLSSWKNEQESHPQLIWSAANGAGPIYWAGPINWAGPLMFFF